MGQAALAVAGAAASFAAALVGVRYVGPKPTKADTLLYRRRQWRRGEVLRVPPADAAAYLKHPMVWVAETDPWDERAPARALSDSEIVAAIRSDDRALLEQCDPALAERIWPEPATAQGSGEPLQAEDAGRLAEHVPALAQAIVQGVADSVVTKIDYVLPLLRAFPPLLTGCITAERDGKNRPAVVKRLESLAVDMLSALQGDTPDPADDPAPEAAGA